MDNIAMLLSCILDLTLFVWLNRNEDVGYKNIEKVFHFFVELFLTADNNMYEPGK
jgi:hypothetical protein